VKRRQEQLAAGERPAVMRRVISERFTADDVALISRAIKGRWDVPQDAKTAAKNFVLRVLACGPDHPDEKVRKFWETRGVELGHQLKAVELLQRMDADDMRAFDTFLKTIAEPAQTNVKVETNVRVSRNKSARREGPTRPADFLAAVANQAVIEGSLAVPEPEPEVRSGVPEPPSDPTSEDGNRPGQQPDN